MAPFHAYPSGDFQGYWGDPIAVFRTSGGTPYRYHLHVGDLGNTFICGRAGSGKTTLIAFLVAQAERSGATVVLWDKDQGLQIATEALGGTYLELGIPTGLSPLKALSDSEEDIGFLTELIKGMIAASSDAKMTEEENRRLHMGLEIVMSLPPQERSMSEIRSFLGVDENGAGARLQKWCWGEELGGVVDCPEDLISLDAPVIGFDQTRILDNPMARGPVMATLFYRVDKLIDGRRLVFVIDEFWKSLLDPAFRGLVNDRLKTLRKRNSPIILGTQSPRDALSSVISHTIKEQCPSQFYFANGLGAWDDYREFGLTSKEFDLIRDLPEGQGDFLLKQGRYSVKAQLPLSGLEDEISVLSGRERTVRMWREVKEEVGSDPVATLDAFHARRRLEKAA